MWLKRAPAGMLHAHEVSSTTQGRSGPLDCGSRGLCRSGDVDAGRDAGQERQRVPAPASASSAGRAPSGEAAQSPGGRAGNCVGAR